MISSSLSAVILLIGLLVQPIQSLDGYAALVILNNGTDSPTMSCSEAEWLLVQGVIDVARSTVIRYPQRQRSLLSESASASSSPLRKSSTNKRRDLGSARCTGGCKFGMKYCRFIGGGCAADTTCESEDQNGDCQRRQRELQAAPLPPQVPVESNAICTQEKVAIDTALNLTATNLGSLISSTCQELVRSSVRQYKCLKLTECNIDHFALWNADTDQKILDPFLDRGTVCSSQRITFQAVTNFHIGKVQLSLTSGRSTIRSKIEYDDPYFLTNTNWGYDIFEGLQLRSGYTYTLRAWPEDNPTKMKNITFTSIRC